MRHGSSLSIVHSFACVFAGQSPAVKSDQSLGLRFQFASHCITASAEIGNDVGMYKKLEITE